MINDIASSVIFSQRFNDKDIISLFKSPARYPAYILRQGGIINNLPFG